MGEVRDFSRRIFEARDTIDVLRVILLSDQVAGFGHDLVPAHGVLGGTAHGVHALGEAGAVRKRKLDNSDALGQELFEIRIGDELNLGALAKDRGVAHARVIVRGAKGRGLIEEHDGEHILQADVGNVAVVDDRGFVGGDAHQVGVCRCAPGNNAGDVSAVSERVCERVGRRPRAGIGEVAVQPYDRVRAQGVGPGKMWVKRVDARALASLGLAVADGPPATVVWKLDCGARVELQRRGAGIEEAGRGRNGTAGAEHWPDQQIGAGTEKQR